MQIKKSQAILKRFACVQTSPISFDRRRLHEGKKRFIDLKLSVSVYAGLRKRNMTFCDTQNFFQLPLSSFRFPPSAFCFPLSYFLFPDLSRTDRSDSANRVDCRSFGVLKTLTGYRPYSHSIKFYRFQKTVYIKPHKTAINRPVDHTGQT